MGSHTTLNSIKTTYYLSFYLSLVSLTYHLAMLLHSEAQYDNYLVDAHFCVAMMHVCIHVEMNIPLRHPRNLFPESIVVGEYQKLWLTWNIFRCNILTWWTDKSLNMYSNYHAEIKCSTMNMKDLIMRTSDISDAFLNLKQVRNCKWDL